MSDIEIVGDQELVFSDNESETPARQKPVGSNTDDILERARAMEVSPYKFGTNASPAGFEETPSIQRARAKRRMNADDARDAKRLRQPDVEEVVVVSAEEVTVEVTTLEGENNDEGNRAKKSLRVHVSSTL